MPNGGSDCCGTCWFNRANGGRAGYPDKDARGESFCEIRAVAIEEPFWTYCANHPHHNPDRIEVPIGPIFVADSYPYTRRVLVECPDTETIRGRLLELLESMPETPRAEYPSETRLDEQVIDQLMAFRERRAIPGLRRILRFTPDAAAPGEGFGRTRISTIGHAVEALAAISGDEALDEIERCLRVGRDEAEASNPYEPEGDRFAAIRYHATRGLEHCQADGAVSLLDIARTDPHPEIVAFAQEILARRSA